MSDDEVGKQDWVLELDVLAEQEALHAASWYDRQSATLGDEFAVELYRVLDQVLAFPLMYSPIGSGPTRRALLPRFPYAVYYQLEPDRSTVLVLAILHTSRAPEVWQKRVDDER